MSDRTGTGGTVYMDDKKEKEKLVEIGTGPNDNEIVIEDTKIYLYEAPDTNDPQRGFYTVWESTDTDSEKFELVEGMSGDDGMIYDKFQSDA